MSHVRILHGTRPRHRKVIRSLRSNCAHSLGKIHVFHLPTANFTDYSFSTRDSTEESKQTRSLALFLCTESTYSAITSLMNYGPAWHYSRTDFFSILQHSYWTFAGFWHYNHTKMNCDKEQNIKCWRNFTSTSQIQKCRSESDNSLNTQFPIPVFRIFCNLSIHS